MRLTFYDGCDRIGGNKFLLEADGTTLLLDFGTSFAGEREYFDEFLAPRTTHGIGDLLDLGLLPPLRGIYRADLDIPGKGWWERASGRPGFREDARVDGLLLTHGHVDHTGYASFLSCSIPVYCSSVTAVVSKAMQDVAPQGMGREVCYVTPREMKDCGLLGSMNARKTPAEERQFVFTDRVPSSEGFREFWRRTGSTRGLIWREPLTGAAVGDLEIRYWPVDHSIPGAGAFGIRTSEGWVVYTGDLRLHGRAAGSTRRFIAEAAELRPLALIVEGTHPAPHDPVSEEDVFENALKAVRKAESLVIADFGPRNIERLLSFLEIAGECGRRLAVSSKDAYLLHALSISGEASVPDPFTDDRFVLYVEARSLKSAWEKTLLESYSAVGGKTIDHSAVSKRPGEFILCFSYYDLNELLDIQPDGGTYVYSSSESYNEEMHMDMDKLRNWIRHFGLRLVGDPGARDGAGRERGFHASGHINGPGIVELVREIHPEYLIPVHTEQPGFFTERFKGEMRLVIPSMGGAITLPADDR